MSLLDQAQQAFETMSEGRENFNFDEVAIMVNDRDLDSTKTFLEYNDWEYWTASQDTVEVSTGDAYWVQYLFFQKEGVPYRLEVMVMDGVSPAHRPHQLNLDEGAAGSIVHVSYKPSAPGLEGYEEEKNSLALLGYEMLQQNHSEYGVFSYWVVPDGIPYVYLKPRVNLRDPAYDPALDLITEEQFLTEEEQNNA